MIKFYRISVFIIALLAITNLGFSQSNEIKIKFIGNCGLHLTDGSSNLYIDFPYKSGAYGYMKYDQTEIDNIRENAIFLFTHKHADHYSKKNLKRIRSKHKGNVFGSWNTNNFEKLTTSINDFKIEAFKTKHRFSFKHYSYLITWHGKRLFLSGDTESAETIATIKDINWAFVPVWIVLDAKEKNLKINADKIGVYHLYPTETIKNADPNKYLVLKQQGEEVSIPY